MPLPSSAAPGTSSHPRLLAFEDWLKRILSLIPLRDALALLSPPILVEKFAKYAASGHKRDIPADDPSARDPVLIDVLMEATHLLARTYFRLQIRGIENVPAAGPALLVGNHNGALLPTDGFFTSMAIRDRFGPERAVYALAHDFLFYDDVLRRYVMRLGLLRAGHDSATAAFRRPGLVLVYPGSDIDAFRPWSERKRVELGGRTGFLCLALRAGVPIVPVVSAGTHEQLIVLTRGDRLAQRLHMRRWARTSVCPIVLSVPWGLTSGFVPYLPLPAQTTVAFGAPIRWPGLTPADADDPQVLQRCYAEVEARMQSMLDELYEGRLPWLGKSSRKAPSGLSARRAPPRSAGSR